MRNLLRKSKKDLKEKLQQGLNDIENIISYLWYDLAGDIIADKYKILFKQELKKLENIAGSMSILDDELTGHKNKCEKLYNILYNWRKDINFEEPQKSKILVKFENYFFE